MIVVVIIGILATLLIPRIMERPEEARRIKAKADIKTIESALKLYKLDSAMYPATEQGIEALIKKPETSPIPKKWKEGGYIEGKKHQKIRGATILLRVARTREGRDYVITSYGSDGEPVGPGRMQTSPARISRKTSGFTLIELMFVAFLLSLFLLLWQSGGRLFKGGRRDIPREVFPGDCFMREDAISSYQERVLEVDIVNNTLSVGSLDLVKGFSALRGIELPGNT